MAQSRTKPQTVRRAKKRPAKAAMDLGVSDVHQSAPLKKAKRRLHVRAELADGGSLHVRHMADGSDVAVLPSLLRIEGEAVEMTAKVTNGEQAPPPKRLVWTQLAEVGSWNGHRAGPFSLNAQVFSEIVTNYKRDGLLVPIDAEHASEADATEGNIPSQGAPAMGWIHDLDNRGNAGLWGLVEWLEPARTYIKEGRYRYLSPAVRFNAKDRVTGKPIGARLSSAAITNSPFLRGLQPLAAKDTGGDAQEELVAAASRTADMNTTCLDGFCAALRSALKLHELASMAECSYQIDRLRDLYETAPHARAMHMGVDLAHYTSALSALMAMPANTSVEALLEAVEEMIEAAIAQHEAAYHEPAEAGEYSDSDDGKEPVAATLTAADAATDAGGDTMSAELIARMKDHEDKLTALSATVSEQKTKLDAQSVEVAEKTLALKDVEAKNAALEAEVKSLKDVEATRVSDWKNARVTEAIDTHKDKKNLSEDDRSMLALLLDHKPEQFEKNYPRVSADKRHLLRDLTGSREKSTPNVDGGEPVKLSHRELTRKLMGEKRISLGAAQLMASRILAKAG